MERKDDFDLDGYYDEDYRDEYITKHNRIRILQKPIVINNFTMMEMYDIIEEFMKRDDCNKLIVSFFFFKNLLNLDFISALKLTLINDTIFCKKCNKT